MQCLTRKGDVPAKRGMMIYDHKTAGALEISTPEQFTRLRELPSNIEERMSRL